MKRMNTMKFKSMDLIFVVDDLIVFFLFKIKEMKIKIKLTQQQPQQNSVYV